MFNYSILNVYLLKYCTSLTCNCICAVCIFAQTKTLVVININHPLPFSPRVWGCVGPASRGDNLNLIVSNQPLIFFCLNPLSSKGPPLPPSPLLPTPHLVCRRRGGSVGLPWPYKQCFDGGGRGDKQQGSLEILFLPHDMRLQWPLAGSVRSSSPSRLQNGRKQ